MAPFPLPSWPIPQLTLRVDELDHPGTDVFFAAVPDLVAVLKQAVTASYSYLYTPTHFPTQRVFCPILNQITNLLTV